MLARFEEKLKTDEEDGKKASEVVQAFQHALDYKNRSVVERASEKFMQDVEDDQDLESVWVWRSVSEHQNLCLYFMRRWGI